MTTDEILKEIERFGFLVTYDEKSNLPNETISFLATLDNLGYDKINIIIVKEILNKSVYWRPYAIAMKSSFNTDLLTYGIKITQPVFFAKLASGSILNITNEDPLHWDWLKYVANISDILDENIDPVDEFDTDTGVPEGDFTSYEDSTEEG